jgi:hypothetical protein
MFDVAATKRFYIEYLGCSLDWEDGGGDRPVYMQVSRDALRLHLSSHHDDGTPGSAVLIMTHGLAGLHQELSTKDYPFLNPGIGPGPGGGTEMGLIDPASNRLRFFEPASP